MAAANITRQSVTEVIAEYLDTNHAGAASPLAGIDGSTASILEHALERGLTVAEYVRQNPEKALMEAEASLAEWLKIQSAAAMTGSVETDQGIFTVSKNMTALINARVEAAQKQYEYINELAYVSHQDGEKRKEHLTRVLYNRAVKRGDTRALMYLIDRVDGRPVEAQAPAVDTDYAYNVYQILHSLFDRQLNVLNRGVGTQILCCSRRSGKTHLLAAMLLIEALRVERTTCLYIGKTMEQSELLINGAINQIVDMCKLRDKKGKRLDWRHLDNGSLILIRGLSNTHDPDQIRGHKAKVIVIDEFFHLAVEHGELLEYLIREVLRPMQMDYATSYKFICSGTPPSVKGTYGEHCWKTWPVEHDTWTYKDNPYPLDPALRQEFVDNELAEMGLDMSSIFARREYGAEWVYDDDLLLYPDFHCYDPNESLPSAHIDMCVMGIDYGVSDNDTLIGIAWDTAARRGYVFHEDKFNRLDIKDRTVSQLAYLQGRINDAWSRALQYFPTMDDKEANKRILWVADDNEQRATEYFNMNCSVPGKSVKLNIMNAHKTDKVMMFDKIRDLLRTGSLMLPKDGKTAVECLKTVLRRGPGGQVYPEIDDKVFHPDLLPAMRYALYPLIGIEKTN